MEISSQKRTRVSYEQRKKMLEFMMAHPDFARNRVSGADAACKKLKLQVQLTTLLNSCSTGASKSSDKWMKCWQDWRSDVRAKATKIQRAQQQTGGGLGPAPLSTIEETLMEFIGRKVAENTDDTLELEIPAYNIELEEATDDPPVLENTRTTDNQDKLEECLETQAAAMDQLSHSMNNLAAAINNLAVALNSMAIKSNTG